MTEDETVGWHHRLNGYEFEQPDSTTVKTRSAKRLEVKVKGMSITKMCV